MNNLAIRYTDERNTDKGFLKVENLIITKSLEELTYITFDTTSDVAVQGTIVWDGQPYEVTEVSKGDNNTLEVYAVQDVRDLKSALRRSVFYTGMTAAAVIRKILQGGHTADSSDTVGSDWTFVTADNITRKRDIDLDYTTVWDALMEVRDIWHIELEIDSEHKKITLYGDRSRGKKTEEQTSHFHLFEGVNVGELELEYEGDEFYNIIQGYGQKTTKKTDKEWIEYKSTKAIKKTDTIPAHTTYYSSKTEQDAAHAVARKWVEKDPHASDPDAKTTMFQLKVNGEWGTKYYASTRNYDTNGNLVDADDDQNTIVKSVTTTFTEKSSKIYKTTQTTKLLRAKDATDAQKQEILTKYGFSMSGSTIYCYDYSNIKNRAYLQSDKYDDLDALLEDMCLYLRESYQPKVNLSVSMAQLPGDYRKDIGIGDSVVIKTKDDKKFVMRVLSMTYDIEKPDNVKLTLGTRKKSLADSQRMQKRFNAKNTSNGSLTSAATNNVKMYTNADGNTEYAITGAFVTMDELDDVLDLANSRMTIQNIDASNITAGEIDAGLIEVTNLNADNITSGSIKATQGELINLDTGSINGHMIAEGSILADALNDAVFQSVGGNKIYYCNWEDMQNYMNVNSEDHVEFHNGDTWFELVQAKYTESEQPNGIWYWDSGQVYYHLRLGTTHWIPKKLDAEDFAANCITANEIKAGAITSGKIAAGAITADKLSAGQLMTKSFYVGPSWSDIKISFDGSDLSAKLGAMDISSENASEINMWNRSGALIGSQMTPRKIRVGTINSGAGNNKVSDTGYRTELTDDGIFLYNSGSVEAGSFKKRSLGTSYVTDLTTTGNVYVGDGVILNNGYAVRSYNGSGVLEPLIWMGSSNIVHIGNDSSQNILRVHNNIETTGDVTTTGGVKKYAAYSHVHINDSLQCTQVGDSSHKCKVYLNPGSTSTSAANLRISSSSGALIDYRSSSRRDVKHDIVPIEQGPEEIRPEKLYDVEVVSFKYNDDYVSEDDSRYQKDMPGFIIDDMMETYPIGVDVEDGVMTNWNEKMILPAMLKLIQDQKKEIDDLKQRVAALENKEALENEANEARN